MRACAGPLLLALFLQTGCQGCGGCGGSAGEETGTVDAALLPTPSEVDAGPAENAAPPARRQGAVLRRSVGDVTLGQDGGWRTGEVGTIIGEQETVRTAPGGEATVELSEGNELDLGQSTEVIITSLGEERARVQLQRGRIGASLDGKTLLQVGGAGSPTVAEARKGRLSVYANGRGLVAVAAETAEVQLLSPTGNAVLGAGEQAVVLGEQAPEVAPIPEEVFLNVAWPETRAMRNDSLELQGQVQPGSEVQVNGSPAIIDEKGRFRIEVPLHEGRNALKVVAADPLGRETESTQAVTVRRSAPEATAETGELWE